jgi:hypothetical protein
MDAARASRKTPRGCACFLELISAKPDNGTEARDLFRVKISNFGHIEPAHQQLILTDYRTHLSSIVAHSDAKAQEVQKASGLAPAERPYVLEAIDKLAITKTALAQAAGMSHRKLHGQKLDRNVILLPDGAVATGTLLIVGASKNGDRTGPRAERNEPSLTQRRIGS